MSSEAKDLSLMQQEVQDLEQLNKAPLFKRWKGYTKYTGPAFLEAATTLGAVPSPPVPRWAPLMDTRCSGSRSIRTFSACSC